MTRICPRCLEPIHDGYCYQDYKGYTGWENYLKEQEEKGPDVYPLALDKDLKALEKRIEDLFRRIVPLEAWNNQFIRRVTDLEEWKKQEDINHDTDVALAKSWMQDIQDLKQKVKDLDSKLNRALDIGDVATKEVDRRLGDLEEWKRDLHTPKGLPEFKRVVAGSRLDPDSDRMVIDKKVWEEIKNEVKDSHEYHNSVSSRYLVDLIKKVDKDFCPSD